MPGVVRKGDVHVGHASPTPNPFHRTSYVAGSEDTFVNGRNVQRIGDKTSCSDPATGGSPTVYCNGIPVHRLGDSTGGHGSWVPNASASSSTNVFCDGTGPQPQNLSVIEPIVFFDAAYREPPASYPVNIQPRLTVEDYTQEGPPNSEQIDDASEPTAYCDPEAGILNPYDVAYDAWGGDDDRWREVDGSGSNILIDGLWSEIGYDPAPYSDGTAWCAVFVSAILKRSGLEYIKTSSSRRFATYGTPVASLDEAQRGDLVVFYRNGQESQYGHVGFYVSHDDTTVTILGGNQNDTLNVTRFRQSNPARGWGIDAIRRTISCADGETPPPQASQEGGSVT